VLRLRIARGLPSLHSFRAAGRPGIISCMPVDSGSHDRRVFIARLGKVVWTLEDVVGKGEISDAVMRAGFLVVRDDRLESCAATLYFCAGSLSFSSSGSKLSETFDGLFICEYNSSTWFLTALESRKIAICLRNSSPRPSCLHAIAS
jgi:hypothetical protein